MMKFLYVFLLAMMCSFSFAGTAEVKSKIIQAVELDKEAELKLIKNTVNINSGTHHLAGVRKVGKIYQKQLAELGFKTKWIDEPSHLQRAGHLFAYHRGANKGKKILLIGHIDTVFDCNSPFQQYKQIDNIATGPGVVDMKGGNAVLIHALKALKKVDVLKSMNITVALIGDEENAGLPHQVARKQLIEAGKKSDIALGFEPSFDLHHLVTARRGIMAWKMNVNAMQGHSSLIFTKELGEGAILGMSEFLEKAKKLVKEKTYLTFNPGLIAGGTNVNINQDKGIARVEGKNNVVAKHAYAQGDLRYLYINNVKIINQQLLKLASELPKPLQAKFELLEAVNLPAMAPSKRNIDLLKVAKNINQALNLGDLRANHPNEKGAADIAYIAQYVGALDGLGAIGGYPHSPKEYMDIRKTIDATKRAALLIYELGK